jgi:hypothetical protein
MVAAEGEPSIRIAGLGRPVGLEMDSHQLYILENARVHIYSLEDFTKITDFGRKGMGPGEFVTYPHVHITLDCTGDQLIVGSVRKVSFFSKGGRFIREVKARNLALKLIVLDSTPENEQYLGWSQRIYQGSNYNIIAIFDRMLNIVQEVYRQRDPYQGPGRGYDMLTPTFSFEVVQDKIILPGPDDASVCVFDRNMHQLHRLRVKLDPLPVTEGFKKKMINFLKTNPETREVFPRLKPIRFPGYFPVIKEFFADHGRIYVLTWNRIQNRNEFFIYRMDGEFIERLMVPMQYESELTIYPTLVKEGFLYQLVEDDESQEWVLTRRQLANVQPRG